MKRKATSHEQKSLPAIQLLKRLVNDQDFRELFTNNFEEAIKGYPLLESQIAMLRDLGDDDIAMLTEDSIEELFLADLAVYTPDETEVYSDKKIDYSQNT